MIMQIQKSKKAAKFTEKKEKFETKGDYRIKLSSNQGVLSVFNISKSFLVPITKKFEFKKDNIRLLHHISLSATKLIHYSYP